MNEFLLHESAEELRRAASVRSFLTNVYVRMTAGLAVTALVAWLTLQSWTLLSWGLSGVGILFIIELLLVWYLSSHIRELSETTGNVLFFIYAAINGVTIAPIVFLYTEASLVQAFVCTAGTFGAMSIFGFTTKWNLGAWGRFLLMALIGLIIAMVVNLFVGNDRLDLAISGIAIIVFSGLTAYDTQKLVREGEILNGVNTGRAATLGALSLYLDVINLFLHLLRILGKSKFD